MLFDEKTVISFSVRSETMQNEIEIFFAHKLNRRVSLFSYQSETVNFICVTKGYKISETK